MTCPKCNDTGIVEYTDRAGNDYTLFCDCEIGYREAKEYKDAYLRSVDKKEEKT